MEKIFIEIESKSVSDEVVNDIIEYWNSFGIFKKNTGTEKKTKQLKRMLAKYDIDEFKKYIDRYAEITREESYFFNYRWDLVTFATHKDTKDRFSDDGTLWIPFSDWKEKKKISREKLELKNNVDQNYLFIPNYADVIKHLKEIPYNDYLQTEHWRYFSSKAKKFYGNKCTVCDAKDTTIDVHHKTYENRGREMYDDVILLCRSCHEKYHDKCVQKRTE